MTTFSLTLEQQAALDAFATGENMVIEAGAGTGKTSTLRLLAESTDRTCLYVAYNKAIQVDASKDFPQNCLCKTAHSLAYGAVMRMPNGKALMNRLRSPRVPNKVATQILQTRDLQLKPEQTIPAWIITRSAQKAVRLFCNSADTEITERHVPKLEGVEAEDHPTYAKYVAGFSRKAWEDINSPTGRLKFEHDHYLKIWALTNPTLSCDAIFLDEAQDANPVIAKVVGDQTHAQRVMVGDRCQAIYGWRGAVDAMSNFQTDHHLLLSQSFRFGPAVAEEANKWLNLLNAPLRLTGFEKILSKVEITEDPDAILCRTNAAVIENAMNAQESGKRVAIVGGTGQIKAFVEAAEDLMNGKSTSHEDLAMFKSWEEVVAYAASEEGQDLKVMVKMVETYGVATILAVCVASVDEESADIIVSTAHKAKGREWNVVRIANDFKAPEKDKMPSPAELMLCYVSVTRAKLVLDRAGLSWIDALV